MTICPGKRQPRAMSGAWNRDLSLDLEEIREFGAAALVTLMEEYELARVDVPATKLAAALREIGTTWHHLPITDADVPDVTFEAAWNSAGADLRDLLLNGRSIVIHCMGGLGRTGTIAARLLIELGYEPEAAIEVVRRARPGAIENVVQENYVRSLKPLPCAARRP